MLWQMARDRVPFKGLTRDDFMASVVRGGDRPKLDKSWPSGFSSMLTACWHRDPQVQVHTITSTPLLPPPLLLPPQQRQQPPNALPPPSAPTNTHPHTSMSWTPLGTQVRPSFEDLVKLLDKLVQEHTTTSIWPRRGRTFTSAGATAGGAGATADGADAAKSPSVKSPSAPAPPLSAQKGASSTWF